MSNFRKGLAVVLAAATAFTFAPVAQTAAPVEAEAAQTETVTYKAGDVTKTAVNTASGKTNDDPITLDTVLHKTEKINVAGASQTAVFTSDKNSIATVGVSDGVVTAVASGSAIISLNVGDNNYQIPVNVKDTATDVITTTVDGAEVNDTDKPVELDASAITASNAIKTLKLNVSSLGGLPTSLSLYNSEKDAQPASGNTTAVARLASDGTITALAKGEAYVKITTADDAARKIEGAAKWVKIVVNDKPQAVVNVADINVDLANHKTAKINATSNATKAVYKYSLEAGDGEYTDVVDLNTTDGTVTAKRPGKVTLVVTVTGDNVRETTVKAKINVETELKKKDADLVVEPATLSLTTGTTGKINATSASGAAITFTGFDPSVISVAADGTVTALSAGATNVTVNAAENDSMYGTSKIVLVKVEDPEPVTVKPAKVTSLKVKQAKGAKVTVTWKSQGGNILYRVYKKVGNSKKWSAKNVTGAKTTLSVKKGATVTVKVKAYVKDSNGKTTWGPAATKAKAFKTDKK